MPIPPDVIFETYPFRSSTDTTRALRTPRDRIADEISVLEFGSIATASAGRATIQKAFDSGHNLYFPAGVYGIDGPILIPNDNHHRTIRGAGAHSLNESSDGTAIVAANVAYYGFRDFLWKTDQNYNQWAPISSITGMCFKNHYLIGTGFDTTLITQADPPDVGIYSGNGMGCLYLQISGMRIINCTSYIKCGVGFYLPGINNHISTFYTEGGFSGAFATTGGPGAQTFSCGLWASSCIITSGKVQGCRVGVTTVQGPTFVSELDVERCQWGIMTSNMIPFWDRNLDRVIGPGEAGGGLVSMHALNFESCGSETEGGAAMLLTGTLDINNVSITNSNQIGTPDYHILVRGGGSFKNVSGGGLCNVAGIMSDAATDSIFTQCNTDVSTSGSPTWNMNPYAGRTGTAGMNRHHFVACSQTIAGISTPYNGAVVVSQLPLSNPLYFNDQLVSDCTLPEVDYTTTPPTPNRGKTVLTAQSGGTNLTHVICRIIVNLAATANWTTASTVLTVTTNPGSVVAGMIVWRGSTFIGMVSTFTGTTLTLGTNPNTGSGTTAAAAGSNGDILTFSCWTVA